MTRQWEKFTEDEISTIWESYVRCEFDGYSLINEHKTFDEASAIRLTPIEIMKLVEELMIRLKIKSVRHPLDFKMSKEARKGQRSAYQDDEE